MFLAGAHRGDLSDAEEFLAADIYRFNAAPQRVPPLQMLIPAVPDGSGAEQMDSVFSKLGSGRLFTVSD
jgi:hypothetical protein